jgi:hypothetical protein
VCERERERRRERGRQRGEVERGRHRGGIESVCVCESVGGRERKTKRGGRE